MDCGEYLWSKTGYFYYPNHQYLQAQYKLLKNEYAVLSQEDFDVFEKEVMGFDKDYIGVFLIDAKGENDVLWYFRKIENKWYLIVWDARYFCDA